MTYEPLHHKYRPQSFRELVGQEAIATTLINALRQDKIAPAYLFTGPRGTGKTSSARILAKSLNCLSGDRPTADPCGQCEICQSITKGSSLDVVEIDAASNTGVDNIRELIERAQFAPVQCRYKIYVLDEVHMLSTASFNALLKTLEEPPDRVVFVLATTDPQRVLATIISRCQRFDFRRIPLGAMVKHLSEIASKEDILITDEAVTLVAQIAQGGLRDAESLLDQLSLLSEEVTPEKVWDLVGSVPERDLLELLNAIASDEGTQVIQVTRSILDRGREPLVVLQNLVSFYRDLLIAKAAPQSSELVALTAPTWASLCECAKQWEIAQILHSQQHLKTSEVQIKNTTQPRLWLEVTLLGLLPSAQSLGRSQQILLTPANPAATASRNGGESQKSAPPITPPLSTPAKPPSPPVNPENHHSPPPTAQPTTGENRVSSPAPPPQTVAESDIVPVTVDLQELWGRVLDRIQPFSTQSLIRQHGRLLSFNKGKAQIGIKTTALLKMVYGKERNISEAFQAVVQSPVSVTVMPNPELGTISNSVQPPPEPSESQSSLSPKPPEENLPPPQPPEEKLSPKPPEENLPPQHLREANVTPSPVPNFRVDSPAAPVSPVVSQISDSPLVSDPHPIESDEVLQIAKNFAEFFKGEVVIRNSRSNALENDASDEAEETSKLGTASYSLAVSLNGEARELDAGIDLDEDEDDIPF